MAAAPVFCAAVGVGALCALVMNKNRRGESVHRASACSARATTTATPLEEETHLLDAELSEEVEDSRLLWDAFAPPEKTPETDEWADSASQPKKMSASKLSTLKGSMAQTELEPTFTKMTGPVKLVAGASPDTVKPKTTGDIPFGVNEAYHEASKSA